MYENLIITCRIDSVAPPPGGGGGTPLYKPYRYVPPQRVGFLRRFGLKTCIDFVHFGLESGMVFEETPCERIYRFNSKWIKKEQYANSKSICLSYSIKMMT